MGDTSTIIFVAIVALAVWWIVWEIGRDMTGCVCDCRQGREPCGCGADRRKRQTAEHPLRRETDWPVLDVTGEDR